MKTIMTKTTTKTMIGLLLVMFSPYAASMEISVTGTTVHMSGPVVGGGVRQAQANYQYEQINHVVLSNSNGGNANTGYCIGETIRKHKISTSIEGFCLSSCSRMWLGGVTRKLEGDESNVGLHGNFDILPALSR